MLPASRNTTYTTDSPVLSEDLNDIQDAIIAGAHGDRVLTLSAYAAFVSDAAPGWTAAGGPGFITSTAGTNIIYVPIPLAIGARIKSVKVARYGDGAADFANMIIQRYAAIGAGTLTGLGSSGVVTNPAASWADTTITVASPTAAVDGDSFFLEIVANAANLRVGSIRVTYDHLL